MLCKECLEDEYPVWILRTSDDISKRGSFHLLSSHSQALALVLLNSGPQGGCHSSWPHVHIQRQKGRVGVGVGERWGKKLVKLILSLSFSLLTNGYVKRYRYTDN